MDLLHKSVEELNASQTQPLLFMLDGMKLSHCEMETNELSDDTFKSNLKFSHLVGQRKLFLMILIEIEHKWIMTITKNSTRV